MVKHILSSLTFWVLVAYFGLALTGLQAWRISVESRHADQVQIDENTERLRLNTQRAKRACKARKLIVRELVRLSMDTKLIDEINALNRLFPEIQPCKIPLP